MSDRYQIRIPATIDAKMSAWDVPNAVLQSALDHVRDELAADPVQHLRPAVAPWGERLNLYTTAVIHPDHAQSRYLFMFHVQYGADESSLNVVDCGYLKTDVQS